MASSSSSDTIIEKLKKETECPICLEMFEDPRLLPCSHTLCFKCIKQSMASSGKFQCPLKDGEKMAMEAIEKLPLNRAIQNMIDWLKKSTSSTTGVPVDSPTPNPVQPICIQENKEILNLSALQGAEKLKNFYRTSYGYQFQLSKSIRLLSVEVKVDGNGQIGVFIMKVMQSKTYKSICQSTAGMKWLRIPIEAEIKNKDCIFVYSPDEIGTFVFKYVTPLCLRPINAICSVEGASLVRIDDTHFGDFGYIQRDPRCIEMRIEIEPEKK